MKFAIKDWKAWMPGCSSRDDWRAWLSDDKRPAEANIAPDVSMVPAMLRRRLSPQAKAVFSVALPLLNEYGNMPIVHMSRHGEVERTLGILKDIAGGEMISPMQFSLAVHNAISGMLSIQQNLHENITAIAAGDEAVIPALLEAIGLLSEGHQQVLCVFNDAPVPDIYAFTPAFNEPYAFACVIAPGEQHALALQTEGAAELNQPLPQPLRLIPYLLAEDNAALALSMRESVWQISGSGQ